MLSRFAAASQMRVLAAPDCPWDKETRVKNRTVLAVFVSSILLGLSPLSADPVIPSAPSAPALCASALAPVEQPSFASAATAKAFCIADCGDLNGTVSCSGNTCSAVNQSQTCPTGPGSVTCDGQTTYCPACCTHGTFRSVIAGPTCGCEDGQTTPKDRYQCVNGLWVYQYSFCGGPFCQGF
jgi:hypothetical protein